MIECDYLIVGAGTMGMAFADVLLTESEATVVIVDRYGKPGGHWLHAYPHVRLHQPSAFYGVNSRPLGTGAMDTRGGNAGLFELASGAEVVAYFDLVMNEQFLPSGRVQYFPMSEYSEGGAIVSLVSGTKTPISARTLVDATYSHVTVPATCPPSYDIADGVRCVAPNALSSLDAPPSRFTVVGSGKTGIDAVLWLLDNGVDAHRITWIMPRDAWLLDRATIQPGAEFFEPTVGGYALQMEASALATTLDDLFERLEATGQLMRIDTAVRPTMYRCATVSRAELDQLRTVKDVVRMGHVQRITADEIVLDHGAVPTTPDALHINCTADGLGRRPVVPVYQGDRITVQNVRACQPALSAALVGHVEVAYDAESRKNELCTVIPYPDDALDWVTMTLANTVNTARWHSDPALAAWLRASRLDTFTAPRLSGPPAEEQAKILQKIGEYTPRAITNLTRLVGEHGLQ